MNLTAGAIRGTITRGKTGQYSRDWRHDKEEITGIMDKKFLLTYTAAGYDGFPHSFHAWFGTEDELRTFVETESAKDAKLEVDLAVEIQACRPIDLQQS